MNGIDPAAIGAMIFNSTAYPLPSGALLQASADGLGLFDERKLSDYWKSRKNA